MTDRHRETLLFLLSKEIPGRGLSLDFQLESWVGVSVHPSASPPPGFLNCPNFLDSGLRFRSCKLETVSGGIHAQTLYSLLFRRQPVARLRPVRRANHAQPQR